MKRIYLTKAEKKTLRHIGVGYKGMPPKLDLYQYREAVISLRELGFILAIIDVNGRVIDTQIKQKGKAYLCSNPHLYNPINWAKVSAILSAIAIFVTITIAIVGCSLIL